MLEFCQMMQREWNRWLDFWQFIIKNSLGFEAVLHFNSVSLFPISFSFVYYLVPSFYTSFYQFSFFFPFPAFFINCSSFSLISVASSPRRHTVTKEIIVEALLFILLVNSVGAFFSPSVIFTMISGLTTKKERKIISPASPVLTILAYHFFYSGFLSLAIPYIILCFHSFLLPFLSFIDSFSYWYFLHLFFFV